MRDNTPLIQLKGVGAKTKGYFDKLEIHTVGDLLTTYPRDYESFEPPVKIGNLSGGEVACVYAAVTGTVSEKKVRNLSVLTLTVSDGTGLLTLTFFNMPFLKKVLKRAGIIVSAERFPLMERKQAWSSRHIILIRIIWS